MKNQKEKISTIRTYVLLRKALYELLTEKPFEKISLTDICTRSMVPRSTFYRYFEDKYDLLHYNLVLFFADARLTPDVIISTDIASLKRFLSILFAHFEKHRADYVKIYQLNRQGVLIETMREFLIRIFTEKLTEARKNGAKLKIPEEIFTYLLAEFYVSAAKCYLEAETPYGAKEFVDGVTEFANKDFFEQPPLTGNP